MSMIIKIRIILKVFLCKHGQILGSQIHLVHLTVDECIGSSCREQQQYDMRQIRYLELI